MHRNPAHRAVAQLPGVVTRDVFHQAGGEDAHVAQPALVRQHLVERGHAARRREPAGMRQSGQPQLGAVVVGHLAALAVVHFGAAIVLFGRHADPHVVVEAERPEDAGVDDIAVIFAGGGLHHHRQHRMGAAAVVGHARSWGPVEREVADLRPHLGMIEPGVALHMRAGETGLVGGDLMDGDVGFAPTGEFRQVVGDFVHEGQLAFLDQGPEAGHAEHFGLREQQPKRVVRGGAAGAGVAVSAEQRQLAVAGEGDLRAGVTALGDVAADYRVQMVQRFAGESEAFQVGGGQWV